MKDYTVTVSPKFQIVSPLTVRQSLNIQPGQKMHVLAYGQRLVIMPVRPITEARGSLKGIDTTIERDEEDRV